MRYIPTLPAWPGLPPTHLPSSISRRRLPDRQKMQKVTAHGDDSHHDSQRADDITMILPQPFRALPGFRWPSSPPAPARRAATPTAPSPACARDIGQGKPSITIIGGSCRTASKMIIIAGHRAGARRDDDLQGKMPAAMVDDVALRSASTSFLRPSPYCATKY